MKDSLYLLSDQREETLNVKENLQKYWTKWPWFLLAVIICIFIGILYIRYSPKIYESIAKIKIIDDSFEFDLASDPLSLLGGGSKINLTNEMQVLKSYRLMEQVVDQLNLETAYFEVGNIKTKQIFVSPVIARKQFPYDSLKSPLTFEVEKKAAGIQITDENGNVKMLNTGIVTFENSNFPVDFLNNQEFDPTINKGLDYIVKINNKKETVLDLIDKLRIESADQTSDVLSLALENENPELSEAVLNEVIRQFDLDGIRDRQLISKRTLDFIDERFVYLSSELDSIEVGKKDYKQSNNLSYIEADAAVTVEKKSIAESELYRIQTQIELSKLLKESLNKSSEEGLLPADIGLDNSSVNKLVYEYNQLVLEREKLVTNAGINNPAVRLLSSELTKTRKNIFNSVATYQQQLKITMDQLQRERSVVGNYFSSLPEKEKMLRAIERQQGIKENLFLLLLQKREEAAINYAVTAPSLKIVDFALTSIDPIYPNKLIILGISLLSGLLIPLGFFFTKFTLDTKIHSRADLEKANPDIPILVEIPFIEEAKVIEVNDRSVLAESFRILSTNVNYLLTKQKTDLGQLIYVTSTLKGEGKTFVTLNLALAYASLKKKVLIVGADLRNPQLHTYIGITKKVVGLSDYLIDPEIPWDNFIKNFDDNPYLKICLSGKVPPNAPQLLSSDIFEKFIQKAKKEFDYIIVDTAPTLLVTDTLLISQYADVTLFMVRADLTEKRLLEFSKELNDSNKLNNMAYVINSVQRGIFRGYNYGYGYGYTEQKEPLSWYEIVSEKIKDIRHKIFKT